MKTPYATTPMRSTCRRTWIDLDDEEVEELEGEEEGDIMILQCLEDSIGCQRGEIGMWATDARYIMLDGGVEALHWARFTFAYSMTSRLDPGAHLEDYAQGLPLATQQGKWVVHFMMGPGCTKEAAKGSAPNLPK